MYRRICPKAYLLIGTYPIRSVTSGVVEWEKISNKWRYAVAINGKPVLFPTMYNSLASVKLAMEEKVEELRRKYLKEVA